MPVTHHSLTPSHQGSKPSLVQGDVDHQQDADSCVLTPPSGNDFVVEVQGLGGAVAMVTCKYGDPGHV